MLLKNSGQRYGLVARLLHWSIAILIIGLIWLGWYMVDLSYYDTWYHTALTTHKALGMLVLVLALLKIGWAMGSVRPQPAATLKPWERVAALVNHRLLYLMMVVLPITGYVISTSAGDPISFFDWFEIPALFAAGDEARDLAIDLHFYLAYIALGLVIIHAGAALKHHFVDKDSTLRKML